MLRRDQKSSTFDEKTCELRRESGTWGRCALTNDGKRIPHLYSMLYATCAGDGSRLGVLDKLSEMRTRQLGTMDVACVYVLVDSVGFPTVRSNCNLTLQTPPIDNLGPTNWLMLAPHFSQSVMIQSHKARRIQRSGYEIPRSWWPRLSRTILGWLYNLNDSFSSRICSVRFFFIPSFSRILSALTVNTLSLFSRTMPNPGGFLGLRKEFIEAQSAAYAAAVQSGNVNDILSDIQRRYFKRFPPGLEHNIEPTKEWLDQVDDSAPDGDIPVPNPDLPLDEFRRESLRYEKLKEEVKTRREVCLTHTSRHYSKY